MEFETKLKHFETRLQDLSDQLKIMQKFGLNEDLLLAYMCHNLKISEKAARKIMYCYESFYGEFIKKEMINSIEKNNSVTTK